MLQRPPNLAAKPRRHGRSFARRRKGVGLCFLIHFRVVPTSSSPNTPAPSQQVCRSRKATRRRAESRGETPQTWKEFCEETKGCSASFPAETQIRKYLLIAKFPGAYTSGMSIKEGYKEAGRISR